MATPEEFQQKLPESDSQETPVEVDGTSVDTISGGAGNDMFILTSDEPADGKVDGESVSGTEIFRGTGYVARASDDGATLTITITDEEFDLKSSEVEEGFWGPGNQRGKAFKKLLVDCRGTPGTLGHDFETDLNNGAVPCHKLELEVLKPAPARSVEPTPVIVNSDDFRSMLADMDEGSGGDFVSNAFEPAPAEESLPAADTADDDRLMM